MFGILYMAIISPVHRCYITPAMLRNAVKVIMNDCTIAIKN